MKSALSVYIIACVSGLFSSCQKNDQALRDEIMQNETKIVVLEQKMRFLQVRWERAIPAEQEWNRIHLIENSLLCSIEDQKNKKHTLKTGIEQLSEEIGAHGKKWNLMQQEKRIKAIGLRFETFTSEQRVYQDVSITHVDSQGVHLNHRDGKARVNVDDLSDEQIVYFGLDRSEAQRSKQEEQKQQVAYEQWVDRGIQKKRETELSESLLAPLESESAPSSDLAQEYSRISPFRYPKTQNRTIYRVRNQGKPYYYSVYPLPYTTTSGQTLYYYRSTR
jgi:hypothetical protein